VTASILTLAPCLYLWMLVQVTLHETAHLLAGRAVGFFPFAFTVGGGPLLFQCRMGGVHFQFHCLPVWGMVKAMPTLNGLWWRGPIFSAAGILMDMALLLLMLKLAPGNSYFAMLAGYQVLIIAVTLVPMDTCWQGVIYPNDGKQLLAYMTGRTPAFVQAYEDNVRRYDAAFDVDQSRLMGDPAIAARFADAEADLASGRYAEAVQKFARLLGEEGLRKAERAVVLDSMASIAVVHGDKRFLSAAEDWAKQACALVPDSKTIHGTLGSILVEKGACAEGLALLMPLTSEQNSPVDRALASCYVAKAFHAQGDVVQAGKWLDVARRVGGFPQVCARIESELVGT
jgi:hypothetical protein